MPIAEIRRVAAPLRRQVEEALRLAVARGDLQPGDRIVERDLCARFGVSRPLVREALRQIEAEGLLSAEPKGGRVVATISIEEARQIFEVRAGLEGIAAEAFVGRAGERERRRLRQAMNALEKAVTRGSTADVVRAKNRFYDAVIEGCGNQVLAEILRMLHNRIQLLRGTSLSEPGRLPDTIAEIRGIFEALIAGDAAAARARSTEHIAAAAAVTLRALRRQQSAPS